MTTSMASSDRTNATARLARSRLAIRLASLTPLWVQIVASLLFQTYFKPMVTGPPEILGIPLGVVIAAIAMVWMLIGTVLVWDQRSPFVAVLALMVFTIPSTLVIVMTPAVVLILLNLG